MLTILYNTPWRDRGTTSNTPRDNFSKYSAVQSIHYIYKLQSLLINMYFNSKFAASLLAVAGSVGTVEAAITARVRFRLYSPCPHFHSSSSVTSTRIRSIHCPSFFTAILTTSVQPTFLWSRAGCVHHPPWYLPRQGRECPNCHGLYMHILCVSIGTPYEWQLSHVVSLTHHNCSRTGFGVMEPHCLDTLRP